MKKAILMLTMTAVLTLGSLQVFAAGQSCWQICANRCNFKYDSCILQCEGFPPGCDASCILDWDFCMYACGLQCSPI